MMRSSITSSYDSSSGVAPVIRGSIRPPSSSSSSQQQSLYTRKQHLDSYLNDEMLKRSTRKVSPDDSTYDTVFQSIHGDTLILRVHWPALSPQTQVPPAMTLAGVNARHSWLDSRMRIMGYPPIESLQKWNSSGILLGNAVHEVVKHLQLNPPELIEITDAGLRSIQQPKTAAQQRQQQASHHQQQQPQQQFIRTANTNLTGSITSPVPTSTGNNHRSLDKSTVSTSFAQQPNVYVHDAPPEYDSFVAASSVPDIEMPPIPTQFEQLNTLSREELEKLLSDEKERIQFCSKLPIVQMYKEMLSAKIDENVIQAKKNLTKEEKLQDLHKEVVDLQRQLDESIEKFQELEKLQDQYCRPPDIAIVMKELQNAKDETFHTSERIAEDWLENGAENVDEFLKKFLEERKKHHEYAAKLELMERNATVNLEKL